MKRIILVLAITLLLVAVAGAKTSNNYGNVRGSWNCVNTFSSAFFDYVFDLENNKIAYGTGKNIFPQEITVLQISNKSVFIKTAVPHAQDIEVLDMFSENLAIKVNGLDMKCTKTK